MSSGKSAGLGAHAGRVFTLIVLLGAGVSSRASAHATLLRSTPRAGEVVNAPLPLIRLVFSEQIVAEMSSIELISRNGSALRVETRVDPHDVHALIGTTSRLAPGAYRVVWRIVSADGHPIADSFVFRLMEAGSQPEPGNDAMVDIPAPGQSGAGERTAAGAAVVPAVLRGVAMAALMALMGLLVVVQSTDMGAGAAVERSTKWLAAIAPVAVAAHLVSWALHASGTNALDAGAGMAALGSSVGRFEVARLLLAALAAWALFLARRRRMAAFFACAAVAIGGAIGHPAAFQPTLAMPAKAIHLLAASVWLGSLLTIALYAREESTAYVAQASRASSLAIVAVALVTLSGVLQSALFLNVPSDLLDSAYGRFVTAKVVGLAGLIAFGAYNRQRLMPQLVLTGEPAPLQRSVKSETILMLIVILLGAVMAYVPTPARTHTQLQATITMEAK